MNYKIETIPRFEKDVKRLKKKFPKIKNDLTDLVNQLSSIPAGKSGGFRVITYYKTEDTLYLVTIYSKTEQSSILTEKLKQIIKEEIKKI